MHGLTRQSLGDAGAYVPGYEPRVTLHTTEGPTYPGPGIYHGTNPTFTCDVKRRKTYQHCDVNRAAKALENHPGGVETNRANNVQIEIVAFTAMVTAREFGHPEMAIARFTDDDYRYLHSLLVHIENAGHKFKMATATPWNQGRMTPDHWRRFNGICGHMHVPENNHGDPGTDLKVRKVRGV